MTLIESFRLIFLILETYFTKYLIRNFPEWAFYSGAYQRLLRPKRLPLFDLLGVQFNTHSPPFHHP